MCRRPLENGIDICCQRHKDAIFAKCRRIFGILDGSAPRRDDGIAAACRSVHGFLLTRAEVRLTMLCKHCRDAHAMLFLDLSVKVVEGTAEPRGKQTPDACLSRAHKADQNNVLHRFIHRLSSRAR